MSRHGFLLLVGALLGLTLVLTNIKAALAPLEWKPMFPLIPGPTPTSQPQSVRTIQKLDDIFSFSSDWIATLSAERITTLVVTGDVLTAREVNLRTTQSGDWRWPFLKTAERLREADLTYINLETPLIPNCPLKNDGMIFCGDLRNVEGLKYAGVDIANLANNHMGNQGQAGLKSTIDVLQQNGITVTGVKDPTFLTVKGIKFAFLGYNEVDVQPIQLSEPALIVQQLAEAKKQNADVIVVQFHWGNEYTYKPSWHQEELAHLAIDNGADLVVGNHPHWFQPVEVYKGKVITYSHGNFVFDQMWSRQTREGIVGKYIFYDEQLIDVEFWPVLIENYGQPRWLDPIEGGKIRDTLVNESYKLQVINAAQLQ